MQTLQQALQLIIDRLENKQAESQANLDAMQSKARAKAKLGI